MELDEDYECVSEEELISSMYGVQHTNPKQAMNDRLSAILSTGLDLNGIPKASNRSAVFND